MTDKMFAFMSRLVSISTCDGQFDLSAARITDADLPLLQEAQYHEWVVIKSYASRVTREGLKAFLDEKHRRDDESDNRGKPAQSKPLVILGKVAIWLAGAVVTALIAQAVSVLLQ